MAGTIDDEVKAIIDRAYAQCKEILSRDSDKMRTIVEFLLEHETMTGKQFSQCMAGEEITEGEAGSLFDGINTDETETPESTEEPDTPEETNE